MKHISRLFFLYTFCTALMSVAFAQSAGDYQTFQTGNWNDVNTWEKYNGATWDNPAAETPDSTSTGVTTILSGHNVTVTATVGVQNVIVNSGGTVTVNGDPVVLYIALSGMTVNGTLIVTGNTITAAPYSVTKTTGTLTIGNGGVLQYSQTHGTVSQKGALPIATWTTGSTCLITSAGGTGATSFNSGGPQDFYNLTWNCPTQTGNFGFGFTNNTIGGDLTIDTTGTGRFYFFGGSNGTIHINGNFTHKKGQFATHGTGSLTNDTIYFHGKVKASSGNFSLGRGSQSSGTGTTIWYVEGDSMVVDGATMTMTMQNSNYGLGNTKIYFSKSGSQVVKLNNVTISSHNGTSSGAGFPFGILNGSSTKFVLGNVTYSGNSMIGQVNSGGALDLSSSVIGGSGNFTLNSGGSLATGHASGLNGNLTTSGTITLNNAANYTFNGSVAQVTGSLLPATVNDLTIDNSAGVFNSQAVTVDGVLYLTAGNFDNSTNSVTLGTGGSVNQTGGTISDPPLPVELTSFTASSRGRNVELHWNTATEVNNNGFAVERASLNPSKGGTWEKIGFVNGAGNSNSPKQYSYTDASLVSGKYSYRLKQIDNDGKFSYSGTVEVNVGSVPTSLTLRQNYPNPFNPTTNLEFAVPQNGEVVLKVVNVIGQEVATVFRGIAEAGQVYVTPFNASNLPSGIYFSVLEFSGKKLTQKMLLMK